MLARVVVRERHAAHPLLGHPLHQRHLDAVVVGVVAGHVRREEAAAARGHERRRRNERRHAVRAAVGQRAGERRSGAVAGLDRHTDARRDVRRGVAKQIVRPRVGVRRLHRQVRHQLAIQTGHDRLRRRRLQIGVDAIGRRDRRPIVQVDPARQIQIS